MGKPVTPLVAVDGFITYKDREGSFKGIILIERLNKPYGWALPGGFVDIDETVENALKREMREEVNVNLHEVQLQEIRSKPGRDPRGPVISIVYSAITYDEPKADDDAKNVKLITSQEQLDELNIVFDHRDIINLIYKGQ